MILHPAVIALISGSVLVTLMLLCGSYYGIQILRRWDLRSGSELQLSLERRTYLISTIMSYAFGFQLASIFLFIYTADDLCTLFTGAMCAAGTLFVNDYGYPALILKIIGFLGAGLWLILNYADNRGYDYPLIRKKYALLLIVTPFVLGETLVQGAFFLNLSPEVITSCCGSLFSSEDRGIVSGALFFPATPMRMVFSLSMLLTFTLGTYFLLKAKGGYLFSIVSAATFLISAAALVSFISPYFYELPTHHCPFCILQREYWYVGYPLYLSLLVGAVSGMGVGILMPFRNIESLVAVLPGIQRRLALISVVSFLLFAAIVAFRIVSSGLILEG